MDKMNMNEQEASFVELDRSSYLSWKTYRTVIHTALVCPVQILWRDYRAYCRCWGMDHMSSRQFKDELEDHPDIEIREGGFGRLQSVADGVGVVAEHMTDAHRMPDVFK